VGVTLATTECDTSGEVICAPADVLELFLHPGRTVILILLAMAIVIAILYFGLRGERLVPTKFGVMVEALVQYVRNDIAIGIIGPEGIKYFPYLLTIFTFILVGNLFELVPGINFPIMSRMAIPLFLSLVTYVIFVVVGFAKNGLRYVGDVIWPRSVPIGLRWLVGLIEFVSYFALRPVTLAVRLFANMVAGHLMLTLLLVSGVVFLGDVGDIGIRSGIGLLWFAFGLGIFAFEFVVAVLQAYIFTLLSAVYVQSSVHPEH